MAKKSAKKKTITIYGIKTCGTVKKARKWLDDAGLAYEWVDFRETAPSAKQVNAWVKAFTSGPMRNTSGGAYRALGDEKKTWDDATWAKRFAGDPMLLKRPVLEIDGVPSAVGFKEPQWRELLG